MGRTWRKEEREKNRKHSKDFKEARRQRQNKRRIGEDEVFEKRGERKFEE